MIEFLALIYSLEKISLLLYLTPVPFNTEGAADEWH
jgi:hypothetical protein